MIVIQALSNMAVSTDLMPVTGQTLPFVSYGNSSLLFIGFAIGVILSVSREVDDATAPIAQETEADGDVTLVADNADANSDAAVVEENGSEPEEIIEDNELNIDENERKQI